MKEIPSDFGDLLSDGLQTKLTVYDRYVRAEQELKFMGKYMPYDWPRWPGGVSMRWLPYSEMLKEFSSEISNEINDLSNNVHSLSAWKTIYPSLSDEQKQVALYGFIRPLSVLALGKPYVIKSRFAYSAAHLCHQANAARITEWLDDFVADDAIYLHHTDMYGSGWKTYNRFKVSVECIGNNKFKEATGNFRNAYNHGFPRQIVVGLSSFVKRHLEQTTQQVSYRIGFEKPIGIEEIVDLLSAEQNKCYRAFEIFQDLVGEQISVITRDESRGLV